MSVPSEAVRGMLPFRLGLPRTWPGSATWQIAIGAEHDGSGWTTAAAYIREASLKPFPDRRQRAEQADDAARGHGAGDALIAAAIALAVVALYGAYKGFRTATVEADVAGGQHVLQPEGDRVEVELTRPLFPGQTSPGSRFDLVVDGDVRPAGASAEETLLVIDQNPDCSQSEVGEAIAIKRANMVPIISRLMERELVERRRLETC